MMREDRRKGVHGIKQRSLSPLPLSIPSSLSPSLSLSLPLSIPPSLPLSLPPSLSLPLSLPPSLYPFLSLSLPLSLPPSLFLPLSIPSSLPPTCGYIPFSSVPSPLQLLVIGMRPQAMPRGARPLVPVPRPPPDSSGDATPGHTTPGHATPATPGKRNRWDLTPKWAETPRADSGTGMRHILLAAYLFLSLPPFQVKLQAILGGPKPPTRSQ